MQGNIGPVADALLDALRRGLHHRLPGLPRDRADHLQGPPVRRRPAALRHPHAPPPADADDRRQPGPGAAAPDRAQGRPGAVRRGPARARGDPRPLRRAAAGGLRLRRHRRARGRGSSPPGCGLRRHGRCSPAARASPWGCPRTSGASGMLAAGGAADSLPDGHRAARWSWPAPARRRRWSRWRRWRPARPSLRLDPGQLAAGWRPGAGRRLGRSTAWPMGRC